MPKTRPLSQQRKRRVRVSKAAPFPVPIATVTGESAGSRNWFFYTAVLEDDSVVVRHSGDMDFLYRMGFFGKGNMSRGQPQWAEHWRTVALPWQSPHSGGQQAMLHAKVTSRRRYMTHLKWHLLSTGDQVLLDRLQQDQQQVVEEGRQKPGHHGDGQDQEPDKVPAMTEAALSITETKQNSDVEEPSEGVMTDAGAQSPVKPRDWGEEVGDSSFWGAEDVVTPVVQKSVPHSAAASWESSNPGDADFWGTQNTSSAFVSGVTHNTSVAPWETSGLGDSGCRGVQSSADSCSKPQAATEDQRRKWEDQNVLDPGTKNPETSVLSRSAQSHQDASADGQSAVLCDTDTNKTGGHTSGEEPEPTRLCGAHESTPDNDSKGQPVSYDRDSHDRDSLTADAEAVVEEPSLSECEADEDPPGSPIPHVDWSEFCEEDDNVSLTDGRTLFVVPDSDDEEVLADGRVCRMKTKWKPVVKRDPYTVEEALHLTYEEAFFLSYGLGCLSVLDSQRAPLNLQCLWREFCKRQHSFLPNYVAYHHYRSKNWVPKSGLKFGCTFLLYKDGPPFYHGSYSVVVKFVDEEGKQVEGYGEQRQFSWTSLAGLKRITEHVGKELMFCYVIKPKEMTTEEMLSPKCIPCFRVKELVISRWVSSQEREGKALEEMP